MARKRQNNGIPTFDDFLKPVVQALIELGGSGTNEEINERVFQIGNISEEVLSIPHNEEGSIGEVDYRIGWTKTYLKKFGLLENSSRGVWALARPDIMVSEIYPELIVKTVRENERKKKSEQGSQKADTSDLTEVEDAIENEEEWRETLLNVLYGITPAAFERLTQRILRESGFSQVEVTGKTGDGGIDGKGIVRISGFLSFHVIFQCKRYKGSVTPSQIRDFRGAMQGRADKGLFITTGTFTREAIKEATRDGAPPIDLIDGEQLCEKLKELNLGIDTQLVESVQVKKEWFGNL